MKKKKALREINKPREAKPSAAVPRPRRRWGPPWWTWVSALAGLFVVFEVYAPALNGGFVFDDLFLPFHDLNMGPRLAEWIGNIRPLLMFSFWADYRLGDGVSAHAFHSTNVFLHFFTSTFMALIAAKLLEWAGVAGRARAALAVFSGALFLLHPLQTESVAYVASRSEVLSVLFYFAAFTVFLYRRTESITLTRAIAVVALFGAAVATKEHTLTLPVLLLLTDWFWDRGIRKNAILYVLLAMAAAVGAVFVWRVLGAANTAGFHVKDLTPGVYFFTQCRVIWTYARMFVLPFGQNVDPDVPLSRSLIDHGAILGLAALAAAVAIAWVYRKRYPLASFGVFVYLLLLAPTSSFIPIRDVLAEHRLYLPFLGLTLICLEFMRRLKFSEIAWGGAAALTVCAMLTYQRNQVWASSLTLWQDSVAKSPNKYRPRFQLAFAQYQSNQCPVAVESYEKASHLGPVDYLLLIDWAEALDCAGRANEAIDKLRQAALFNNSAEIGAHIHQELGKVYAEHGRMQEALNALAEAEKIDPGYDMTYVTRGQAYEAAGDMADAAREYRHALAVNPRNRDARKLLVRVSR